MTDRLTTVRCSLARVALLSGALVVGACSEQPDDVEMPDSDAVGDVEKSDETTGDGAFRHGDWTPSPDPTRVAFHGIELRKPATWIETPPVTSLREANYSVPGRRGEQAAELAVLWFADEFAQPMDVHVARLQSQFEPDDSGDRPEPTVEALEIDGLPVTLIDLSGAYVKPGSAWYTPDQRVVMAVFETQEGQLLLRLTGPMATVAAAYDDFRSMLKSARRVNAGRSDPADHPDSAENRRNSDE